MEALRQRKALDPAKLTGANHPTTAFIMMSHGAETPVIKIVPKGCIIVVQVHSGEVNSLKEGFFTNLFNDRKKEKFLDPITNYKYITEKINSIRGYYTPLAIYKEGDEYPDFSYNLLLQWNNDNNSYLFHDSGIAKYPFTKGQSPSGQQIPSIKTVKKTLLGENLFLNLYDKSEYPTREELKEIIDTIQTEKTIRNIIRFPEIEKKLSITQSELFEKLGPGVYYNLVCRATKNVNSFLVKHPHDNRYIINNNQRSLVNSSGHIRKNRLEILQGIVEAEGHRKGFIGQLNIAGPSTTPIEKKTADEIIKDTVNYIENLRANPTNINLAAIKQINNKYYSLLKEYYLKEIAFYEDPESFQMLMFATGQTEEEAEKEKTKFIKKYRGLLDELEQSLPGPVKEQVKNEEHELLLQKQMAEQRSAHQRTLNRAAQNEADAQTAALYMGRNQPALPVQLVENNLQNKNGFKQRQALAEQQAQEAVGKWTRKTTAGGKRTRKIKKKNGRAKRSKLFSKKCR
jgi:hypothetical protein